MPIQRLDAVYIDERLTPDNVDELCELMKLHFDGHGCTLIYVHPIHRDGTPSETVVPGAWLSNMHTHHAAADRATLHFETNFGLYTAPIGIGDPRTSEEGLDRAATLTIQNGCAVLGHNEKNGRHILAIVPQ